jgi:hypothetical protein
LFSILKSKKSKEGVHKKAKTKQPKIKKGLRKPKINKSGIKSTRHTKGKKPSMIGEVHFVHPGHVVKKNELKAYGSKKGNFNPRPVAIVSNHSDNSVSIAQIYGTPGNSKKVTKHLRTKLQKTKMKKDSWIDSEEKNYSERSKKKFESGKPPLNKKTGRLHYSDLKARERALVLSKQKKSK